MRAEVRHAYEAGDYLHLWQIAVDHPWKRTGVGNALVQKVFDFAGKRGLKTIITDYMVHPILNMSSERFFCRERFELAGIFDIADYFGAGPSSLKVMIAQID